MSAVENLRTATDMRRLIERRDPRAWPLAEKLAVMFQEVCLKRTLRELEAREVFVPETEADLVELFGEPVFGFERSRSVPPKAVREVGALAAWHDECRRGVSQEPTYHDENGDWSNPLRAAAAREAEGRDFDSMGLREIGDRCRRLAAEILARDVARSTPETKKSAPGVHKVRPASIRSTRVHAVRLTG